jgi:hypothetical protein
MQSENGRQGKRARKDKRARKSKSAVTDGDSGESGYGRTL